MLLRGVNLSRENPLFSGKGPGVLGFIGSGVMGNNAEVRPSNVQEASPLKLGNGALPISRPGRKFLAVLDRHLEILAT